MSELNKAVADLVIKATQAAEAAGKFAVEQLPDIAHQYVLYVAIMSWFAVVLGVFVMAIPFLLYKAKKDEDLSFIIAIPCIPVGALLFGANISKAIMATFAPKVLLIQWAAELVK